MYVKYNTEARSRIIFAVERKYYIFAVVRARALLCVWARGRVHARACL